MAIKHAQFSNYYWYYQRHHGYLLKLLIHFHNTLCILHTTRKKKHVHRVIGIHFHIGLLIHNIEMAIIFVLLFFF